MAIRTEFFLMMVGCISLAACGANTRSASSDPASDAIILEEEDVVAVSSVRPAAFAGPRGGSVEDFVISAGERVYFSINTYNLDSEDRVILQRQAVWLKTYPSVTVLVGGNADERGTREYNLALGARRASAVKDYLVGLGIDAARIDTISYGKERPLDPDSNEAAWSINRNAHTQITGGAIGS